MTTGEQIPRLMLVTDRRRTRGRDLVAVVAAAVAGGVGLVQVREKDLTDDALRDLVARIRAKAPSVTLVVNARLRVARTCRIGLHLPAASPAEPRKGLPLYGRSAHDADEALSAMREGADFIVLGTVFPTASKPGHRGAGLELVREVSALVSPVPVFAIGGIQVSRVPEVVHAGAYGVAVCGAILTAADPKRVAEGLSLALRLAS